MFGTTSFELPEHCKQVMAEISEFFVSSQYKDLALSVSYAPLSQTLRVLSSTAGHTVKRMSHKCGYTLIVEKGVYYAVRLRYVGEIPTSPKRHIQNSLQQ